MTISVRSARPDDYPAIRNVLDQAFRAAEGDPNADEARLWDYLIANDASLTPDHIRLALDPAGEPVACTVVLPRTIQGPRGPVLGAIITLVACRPDLQRQGYGGATVRDALAFMTERSMAFGILYGEAEYYPRFGFAKMLPELRTILPAAALTGAGTKTGLHRATEADAPLLHTLYRRNLAGYPGAVARGPEPWLWRLRKPETCAIYLLDEGGPAYAVISEQRELNLLYVHEAEAGDRPEDARRLLTGLAREAVARGLKEVWLGTPPDLLVTRMAVLLDAEQRRRPAKHGMVAVTNWTSLLPPGYSVGPQGLQYQGQLILAAPHDRLITLAFGYRTADDLLLAGEARLTGSLEALRADFPARFPKWSLAPFWM